MEIIGKKLGGSLRKYCIFAFNLGRPYGAMPALQFGPGRGRPPQPFQKPFIPNVGARNITPQRNILPAFGQASRLAGNPSVTIQVCTTFKNLLRHTSFNNDTMNCKNYFMNSQIRRCQTYKYVQFLDSQITHLIPNIAN